MHLVLVVLFLAHGYALRGADEAALGLRRCREACNNTMLPVSDCKNACTSESIVKQQNNIILNETMGITTVENDTNFTMSKIVYFVIRRSTNGGWKPMIQTTAFIANNSEDKDVVYRVIIVDPAGIPKLYDSDESKEISKSLITGFENFQSNHKDILRNGDSDSKWFIKVSELVRQKMLVLTKLKWEPRARRGLYLVTWEIDGGGLKGNLFTTSNHVTLSLWPNTVYHIQAELISSHLPSDSDKSAVMTIDTGDSQEYIDNSDVKNSISEEEEEFIAVLVQPFKDDVEQQTTLYSLGLFLSMLLSSLAMISLIMRSRNKSIQKNVGLTVENRNFKKSVYTVEKV